MPEYISDKVLSWAKELEPEAYVQSGQLSRMPFIYGDIALMPDSHVGRGCTVGTVVATQGAVIPATVGVDLGCGMVAALLSVNNRPMTSQDLPDDLSPLHQSIARGVPSGVGRGHEAGLGPAGDSVVLEHKNTPAWNSIKGLEKKALLQMGSLGSGNHFVEVCLDELDRVWVVLHSGSRGPGNMLASYWIKAAQALTNVQLENPDLAYLVENTSEFDGYIADMLWSQDYAMENRKTMMSEVHKDIRHFLGIDVGLAEVINCHHNFCQVEIWNGSPVWVTRKGAIQADTGRLGVIPGSMGTNTYIVEGLGNPASFNSSSHGAGRRMSRGKARRELDVDGLRAAMAGKTWDEKAAVKLIDEDPRSYKNIVEVMEAQKDLTSIKHELHQILNYKGTS